MMSLRRGTGFLGRSLEVALTKAVIVLLAAFLGGCDLLYLWDIDREIGYVIDEIWDFNDLFPTAPFSSAPADVRACQDAEGDPRPVGLPCILGVFPGVCVPTEPLNDQRETTACEVVPIFIPPPGPDPNPN